MPESCVETALLSRRGALKIGLCASAFLATAGLGASLSGCSASPRASGFAILRSSDVVFLQAVIPVMLAGSVDAPDQPGANDATLLMLDNNLNHLSPALLTLTQQLFDVLAMPVTRGPLTGVWGRWKTPAPGTSSIFCSAGQTAASICCAWAMVRCCNW